MIDSADWQSLETMMSIDEAWQRWERKFTDIMEQCIPKSTAPRLNFLWLFKNIRIAIRGIRGLEKQ